MSLDALEQDLLAQIAAASDEAAIEAVRVSALGKKGAISERMGTLGKMAPDERKAAGGALNVLKDKVSEALVARKSVLGEAALEGRLSTEKIDMTLPVRPQSAGTIHPVSQVWEEVVQIFGDLGFSVAEGPHIEDDFHNFDALNMPPDHPARQEHDTFYFNEKPDGTRNVLRTHTSPVQIRTMLSQKPPIRIIAPGRTFRSDSDMTHTPMFNQVEALVIDEVTHLGNLKWILQEFCKAFFEVDDVKMRFRASHFPFTEPSMEVDIQYAREGGQLKIGTGDKWLEILGSGMVHPNVIKAGGLDPDKYQGFAFGMGLDRLAMLKYGIPDLRAFFESDLRWLRHYGFRAMQVPTLAGIVVKFTLSWLKEHLDTTASLDEILDGLIGVGLEVEEVTDKSKQLAAFKVAYVVEAEKHPNADKLKLCKVETDAGIKQVVCGAPNARAGMKAIIALPGAVIPATGETLQLGSIRGQESQAMMCSERELMLSEEHNGIIEVIGDWPVGTPAAVALGLNDPMIYIKVTANRPDALGVYGLARDLAAKGLGTLKPLKADAVMGTFKSPIAVLIAPDNNSCKLFVGRYFKGVKNGPSPKWLQDQLRAIGLRPISALVDITNYMTFTYARPLHVFDADKVHGNITARIAKDGEQLLALDGKTYGLTSTMTVIADDKKAEGIAGIMGGEASGCMETTTNVFLEAAYFDPRQTAATGRKLSIHSDARYRFERGIDPAFTQAGAEIATRMILDLCGGEASDLVIAGAVPNTARSFTLRKTRVKTLGGVDIPWAEQLRILRALGFVTSDDGVAQVPSWRPDVNGEADLVEEICRIHGLDKVPNAPMSRPHDIARPILNNLQKRMLASRRTLATRGFNECVTWAFLPEAQAKLFGGGQPELKLGNPISSELSDMRPSLLPNLIAAVGRNAARGFADVQLCEVGHAYAGDKMADETLRASGIRRGAFMARSALGGARNVDAYDAKADVLAVIEACGLAASSMQVVQGAAPWYHPGRSGTMQLGPQNKIAMFGEIHPRILSAMDVKGPLVAFEIILNALPTSKQKSASRAALSFSDLLPVSRDFAFVVDDKVQAAELIKAVKGVDKLIIAEAQVFDVYQLEGGKKSLAVEVTLQPKEKTFTDADIEAISAKIVATANKAVGAILRG